MNTLRSALFGLLAMAVAAPVAADIGRQLSLGKRLVAVQGTRTIGIV